MFGYTVPIESMLSTYDKITYRNYYCETCHYLRKDYGLIPTIVVNYEMTFISLFFNSILEEGIHLHYTPKRHFCIMRENVSDSDFMHKLTAYSILVANNSLLDNKVDGTSPLKTNLGLLCLNRAIVKARKKFPEYDSVILKGYRKLVEIEQSKECDVVTVGSYSAQPMLDVFDLILGEKFNEKMRELFTHLGIWVYVMDAIEDLDKDHNTGNYNPFLINNTSFTDKRSYIKNNIFSVGSTMGRIIDKIQNAYYAIKSDLRCNVEIFDNIIYRGIPYSAHRIISSDSMNQNPIDAILKRMNRGALPTYI